ncbi:hypothetical protein ACFRKB_32320 [Streptomyces scopuliridis]|uniref:hypothetical protein n=1 Tax=Streptomyces scopuliridis TaxID=452529 RepID=UPI0036C803ED
MGINTDYKLTGDQIDDIVNNRLRPYLPTNLAKVDPQTYHLRYTFNPAFTGQESEPQEPSYKSICDDPKLSHEHWDKQADRPVADEAEYDLREAARFILSDVYRSARDEWRNARYIADIKAATNLAGGLWKQHNQAKSAVEAAFSYLRDPEAAKEWPAAVSRLIDTQDTYLKAAIAFDERAHDIATVHDKNMYEESLGYREVYAAAGVPDAWDWPVVEAGAYGSNYLGKYDENTAAGKAQARIAEQEAHVAKVGQLLGRSTDA